MFWDVVTCKTFLLDRPYKMFYPRAVDGG